MFFPRQCIWQLSDDCASAERRNLAMAAMLSYTVYTRYVARDGASDITVVPGYRAKSRNQAAENRTPKSEKYMLTVNP
jgi:hypothetical protein